MAAAQLLVALATLLGSIGGASGFSLGVNGQVSSSELVKARNVVPRLITFDATGTLLRLRASEGLLYRDALLMQFPELRLPRPDAFQKAFDKAYQEQCIRQPCFGCGSSISSEEWWLPVMEQTFANVLGSNVYAEDGKAWDDEFDLSNHADEMENVYADLYYEVFGRSARAEGAWELRQDVEMILHALKTEPACEDVCVGIVSNFDDRLDEILECLGIKENIDFVVTSRQVGQEKPNRVVFDIAMQRARAIKGEAHLESPQYCMHVGDTFTTDVEGAHNAGWQSMLLMEDEIDADVLVKSIDEGLRPGIDYTTITDLWPVLERFGISEPDRALRATSIREEHYHNEVGWP